MKEAVDGIQSALPIRRARRFTWRFDRVRLVLFLGIALCGIGIVGSALAVGTDTDTLLALRTMIPAGHYLVLFQNNAELRPSGGFIGSFATVDIGPIGIKRYMIDTNIYKRDKAFTDQHTIQPPPALLQMSPGLQWAMRDANWDLDFRDAASRVAWFYQQEGGEHVDGVVAVNASVVQDVLRLTGPILVNRLDGELSADTFFPLLAKEVEQDYFKDPSQQIENEPKSVLKELVPALVARGKRPTVAIQLPALLRQELAEKQVQLFQVDQVAEQRILAAGWGGAIDREPGDYLLINNASVGGMKSSLFVGQETAVDITPLPDGSAKHVVTVTRTHTGTGVWPDGRNNNYIRIAVPLGSLLQAAVLDGQAITSVDTTTEAEKTVFGTRFDTEPGHTSTLQTTYIVPATGTTKPFKFIYQKQSGTLAEVVAVTFDSKAIFKGTVQHDVILPGVSE